MTTEQIINKFETHLKNIATEWNSKLKENTNEKEKSPISDLSELNMMSEFDFFD